jgi:alpha-ketoglutarate-dependent taurine dioxygenase
MEEVTDKYQVELPLIVELGNMDPESFIAYYLENRVELEQKLHNAGAIKFRGVLIDSLEVFQRVVGSISTKFLNYIDGTSPRTKLSGGVYTSTEYDKTMRITMHNENSYSAKWPNKLFLSCLQPAETGGETLLADSREILKRMDKDIVEEIEARGITYIRNLHGGEGMGISWQQTFEINERKQLEEYCKAYSIQFEWREDNGVRLKQPSRGIIEHRESKERVWFNQIDQFHPYQLGEELYEALLTLCEAPEDFPTYVTFGDGKVISEDIIRSILKTTEEVTIAPPWSRNELLVIDNELVSHGRNPYTGDRKVLLSMSE